MSYVALLYMSREGQTRKIINRIADQLRQSGHDLFVSDIRDLKDDTSLSNFDAVVLGCSIRYGKHHKPFRQFVEENHRPLSNMPSYFFSVNLTARKPQRSEPSSNRYLQKYLNRIAWEPKIVEVFAGALLYPRYDILDRHMIQLIMKITKGPTDLSQETEFTNWERVRQFARAVDQDLHPKLSNLPGSKPNQVKEKSHKQQVLAD